MELADGLQSSGIGEPRSQPGCQKGVDKLLKVVPLVCTDRDQVIEYLLLSLEACSCFFSAATRSP